MSNKLDRYCTRCGAAGVTGSGSAPADRYVCLSCRRVAPAPYGTRKVQRVSPPKLAFCTNCHAPFTPIRTRTTWTQACSKSCAGVLRWKNRKAASPTRDPKRAESDRRRRRYERILAARGLTEHGRRQLLTEWRRLGRSCTYCDRPVATIDHIVPLARGGTNYEGNLTPACRPCNSSKGTLLLVEWRKRLATVERKAA